MYFWMYWLPPPQSIFLLDIFLKSFPVQPGELKDKLFIVNEEDGGLSDEHITSLRRYEPVPEKKLICIHSLKCHKQSWEVNDSVNAVCRKMVRVFTSHSADSSGVATNSQGKENTTSSREEDPV